MNLSHSGLFMSYTVSWLRIEAVLPSLVKQNLKVWFENIFTTFLSMSFSAASAFLWWQNSHHVYKRKKCLCAENKLLNYVNWNMSSNTAMLTSEVLGYFITQPQLTTGTMCFSCSTNQLSSLQWMKQVTCNGYHKAWLTYSGYHSVWLCCFL